MEAHSPGWTQACLSLSLESVLCISESCVHPREQRTPLSPQDLSSCPWLLVAWRHSLLLSTLEVSCTPPRLSFPFSSSEKSRPCSYWYCFQLSEASNRVWSQEDGLRQAPRLGISPLALCFLLCTEPASGMHEQRPTWELILAPVAANQGPLPVVHANASLILDPSLLNTSRFHPKRLPCFDHDFIATFWFLPHLLVSNSLLFLLQISSHCTQHCPSILRH